MVKAMWTPGGADISDALDVRLAVCGIGGEQADKYAWHLTAYDAEEKAVGAIRLRMGPDVVFVLDFFAVREAERGQGYGDLIARTALFKALEMGARRVRAETEGVFFLRYGLRETENGAWEASTEEISLKGSCSRDCAGCESPC